MDTPSDDPFALLVREALVAAGQDEGPQPPARFFTDASALAPLLGADDGTPAPTVVLGPGEPDQCHVVDEWCSASKVEAAVEVYTELLRLWYAAPAALDDEGLPAVVEAFAAAAVRADRVGFDVVELHAATGTCCTSSSRRWSTRGDRYGGDLAGRARLLLEVTDAVRAVWPDAKPLLVRVSATDWVEAGGTRRDRRARSPAGRARRRPGRMLHRWGGARRDHPLEPGYQVPFAARVRREAGVPAGAVGLITDPAQAQHVVSAGMADAVLFARAMLRDPRWVQRAATELGADLAWPPQYERARTS